MSYSIQQDCLKIEDGDGDCLEIKEVEDYDWPILLILVEDKSDGISAGVELTVGDARQVLEKLSQFIAKHSTKETTE